MKCAIYVRNLADNQAEKGYNSCGTQEEKIKTFIGNQKKYEIFDVYRDVKYTGTNLDRPALKRLLNDIINKKIEVVFTYKINCLTRSSEVFCSLINFFEKYKVAFISVAENFDASSLSGSLFKNIVFAFAHLKEKSLQEQKIGNKWK